jgi:hypothetical protein
MALQSSKSVEVQRVSFSEMRINGMPFYVAPITKSFKLEKGQQYSLPELSVMIYFRDLESVAPLRAVIENKSVQMTGRLAIELKLALIERIALRQSRPEAVSYFAQEAPVQIAGGPVAQKAMLATLDVVQRGLESADSLARRLQIRQSAWQKELEQNAASLLRVRATYALISGHKKYQFATETLGFLVSPTLAVIPSEVLAPWKYDAELLAATKEGKTKIDESSLNLLVWPASAPPDADKALTLTKKNFTVETVGHSESKKVILPNREKTVSVQKRASGNLALLHFTDATASGLTLAPEAVTQNGQWDRLAVFRLRSGEGGRPAMPEVIYVAANRQKADIELADPVDASVFGSPIIAPEGVIGIVQDETEGMLLPDKAKPKNP